MAKVLIDIIVKTFPGIDGRVSKVKVKSAKVGSYLHTSTDWVYFLLYYIENGVIFSGTK